MGAAAKSVAPARKAIRVWRRFIFLCSRFYDNSRANGALTLPLGTAGMRTSGQHLDKVIAARRGVESHDGIDNAIALTGRKGFFGEARKLFRNPRGVEAIRRHAWRP